MNGLTARERVSRTVNHLEIDQVPHYYFGVKAIDDRLKLHFGLDPEDDEGLLQKLQVDVRYVRPVFVPVAGEDRKEFEFGDVHARLYDKGSEKIVVQKKPLEDAQTVDEVLGYAGWPQPDWFNYQIPAERLPDYQDKYVVAYDMGIIFLYAMGMRGMQNISLDMAGQPEMAHAIFGKIAEYNLERTHRFLEANPGLIQMVGMGDDVAGQNGLFFSPRMWRTFIRPHIKNMVDLCHDFGVPAYFHGCGGFRALFNEFIELGIKCVGRLQTEAKGNDFASVKAEFGEKLCLWGALDGQHILVEGSTGQVKDHVMDILEQGRPNGFVAGPTHTFTDDVPLENILAVYEVLNNQRVYPR